MSSNVVEKVHFFIQKDAENCKSLNFSKINLLYFNAKLEYRNK